MVRLAEATEAGSAFEIAKVESNTLGFIKTAPSALATTLFRPWPRESRSPFLLMAAAENVLIFGLLLLALVFHQPWREINWNLVALALLFTSFLFVLIGWTTPVMGALVRYKVPALPFLAIIAVAIVDWPRLQKMIPGLRPGKPTT